MCKCLLVSLGQHLVLITLIVEKAASQLYLEPNMVKMYRATFLRPGKAVSETIWSQKVAGSVLPNCSFRATSAWDQPVASGEAQHLPNWIAVWLSLRTLWHQWLEMFLNGHGVQQTFDRFWQFSISLSTKSTKEDTSLCPWTCSCTAGKCAQSSYRSSLNTSCFLWKEQTAVIKLNCPCPSMHMQLWVTYRISEVCLKGSFT